MTQLEWLSRYIVDAFEGVTLSGGVDIHAASLADSYGNHETERRLSKRCQRGNWRFVEPEPLRQRAWDLTFLDANAFRFYLPVMMLDILDDENASDLTETLFYQLTIAPDGTIKGTAFSSLFTRFQRAAIIRFLKYLVYNRGWGKESDAGREPQGREGIFAS